MRTLLVEFRPAASSEAELLQQVAEATTPRTQIPLTVTIGVEHSLPSDVQIGLYRIAQQALSHAARHAEPGGLAITLRARPEGIERDIRDDGCGFDLAGVTPGRFGLSTIRERADGIGAILTADSTPGRGTQVVVRWPRQAR
jgi:signal transduction histidine kinase